MSSATLSRCSKNVVVKAVIIAELELSNVKTQVSFAVECPKNTALEDAPEALNRVGVHCTDEVLMPRVIDGGVWESLFEIAISSPLIGAEQANLVRNCFVDESLQRHGADILNDARDNVALATDRARPAFLRGFAPRSAGQR